MDASYARLTCTALGRCLWGKAACECRRQDASKALRLYGTLSLPAANCRNGTVYGPAPVHCHAFTAPDWRRLPRRPEDTMPE